jgi:hypothetical protein
VIAVDAVSPCEAHAEEPADDLEHAVDDTRLAGK